MKICVSIDSESYTTLYNDKVTSVKEAVTTLRSRFDDPNPTLRLRVEKGKESTRITLENGDNYFVVAQIFDIPDERYATIWWHAYDGVDFKVTGTSNDLITMNEQFKAYMQENWISEGYEDEDYEDGNTFAIIDTDNEWECLEIVDLAEKRLLIVENPLVKEVI